MWLFFTTLGSFSKMSDTTMLDLSGDHKPLCQRVFSVQSSIDIMGRCYSQCTMNRWKFMFHKKMLHSVPTNFRDNSSILVIFVVALHSHPFFCEFGTKLRFVSEFANDKCVNLFGWIMTQKCSNIFVNFSFNWKSHFSVLPT